jgi:hypothetical protein
VPKFLLFKVTLATTVASNQGGTPSAARVKAVHGAHKPFRVLDANVVADWHRGINCRPEMIRLKHLIDSFKDVSTLPSSWTNRHSLIMSFLLFNRLTLNFGVPSVGSDMQCTHLSSNNHRWHRTRKLPLILLPTHHQPWPGARPGRASQYSSLRLLHETSLGETLAAMGPARAGIPPPTDF